MALATDGDLALLHRFEQGRLHLRRRTVHLVRQNEVGEDRTFLKAKLAFAAVGKIDLRPGDVGGQEVGGELDARQLRVEVLRHALDGPGLGEPRQALDEQVAVAEQAQQQALDHAFLADDRFADALAELLDIVACTHEFLLPLPFRQHRSS
ncbi:hypothetical protein D9M72_474270 [compost metagenome]